jgi:hypothetical protein
MHHQHPELDVINARNRYETIMSEVQSDRLARAIQGDRPGMLRKVAHYLGRNLVRTGARLLRYARTEQPVSYWVASEF